MKSDGEALSGDGPRADSRGVCEDDGPLHAAGWSHLLLPVRGEKLLPGLDAAGAESLSTAAAEVEDSRREVVCMRVIVGRVRSANR